MIGGISVRHNNMLRTVCIKYIVTVTRQNGHDLLHYVTPAYQLTSAVHANFLYSLKQIFII